MLHRILLFNVLCQLVCVSDMLCVACYMCCLVMLHMLCAVCYMCLSTLYMLCVVHYM